jgi:hypothetical protein
MRRKVRLEGHGEFWFLDDDDEGVGALAPLEHCDSRGELLDDSYVIFHADSYAHCFADGTIKRYRQVIGSVEDLVDV